MVERTPRERDTLLFSTPEAAQEFSERTRERIQQENRPGLNRTREVIADEVAKEFVKEGEAADSLKYPWQHTDEEHTEVQQLVNMAFEKDLRSALAAARSSPHYPRNLDLLHDVLTTEMYQLLTRHGLNKQPLLVGGLALSAVVLAALMVLGILFFVVVSGG